MHESVQQFTMSTPFGEIGLTIIDECVHAIDLDGGRSGNARALSRRHPVYTGLRAYFTDPAFGPDLPLSIKGTAFQKRVWHALQRIPSGETRTYGELARRLNTSARAVGNACRANPVPLLIPCHRVVAVNGLGGFAGDRDGRRVGIKRWLLDHEGGSDRPS